MRVCARGPSGMLTPSTPASFKSRIELSVFVASQPFGGKTSTEVTNSPFVILRDQWESSSLDRKSTRLNSSHLVISYAVFCLKKKNVTPSRGTLPVSTQ